MTAGASPRSAPDTRFLRAIWTIPELSEHPVTVSRLARSLGHTPGTVSDRIKRLASRGLVEHERYGAVALTPEGKRDALRAVRVHRQLRCVLAELFDYPWPELSDDAEGLEVAVTDRFMTLAAQRLGSPEFDPYGEPIPRLDGTVPALLDGPLMTASTAHARISRVVSASKAVLRTLDGHSLRPGATLQVVSWNPSVGVLRVTGPRGEAELGLAAVRSLRTLREPGVQAAFGAG
ncbi:DtxR family iron (metal) dependent repressor [Leucobacter komagatae]|uniref:Manganese transport regulator n=1 Tax=Leucobacter komagatae TaxID=55969 RepID=A0A542Y610_9MICO|nr:metal-dependent transcriptional regulator [Leucobacter komagatae]TQL43530.1 DtxR family iron (metal) dependent repressor [Leucobacter komagatae]